MFVVTKVGNSLKKCDLPDSSYGTLEIAAGLNAGFCEVGPRKNRAQF
jgi:hypothetical protein